MERTTTNRRNVLIAVDIQNDFVDGSLAVTDGDQVIAPLNQMAGAVRDSGGTVAFTRDWHPASTPHFDAWPVHCVENTDGAAFAPTLDVTARDVIISKGTGQTDGYSGAEGTADDGTTLEQLIMPEDRERVAVFIGGLATDYCVKATAIDISTIFKDREAVEVFAIREAMRAVNINPEDEIDAINAMAAAGAKIITVDDALAMIDETRLER